MTRVAATCAALLTGFGVCVSAQRTVHIDLEGVLERAGARVAEYFARAQSIVCLEKVSWQKLSLGFSADGPPRFVESELRLSWEPTKDDPMPKEARSLRNVLRVNGHPPRKKDYNNCTTPEQEDSEEQPLSMLLPESREQLSFEFDGREVIDGRNAVVVRFREKKMKPTVEVSLVEDNENCISFDIDGGMRGKLWIDAETNDVLRLDRSLSGLVEIPLPRKAQRVGIDSSWTMERWDSSIRFKPVKFDEPSETLVLPISASTMQITRGSGTPRLRTTTQYTSYRRFMTGGRVVPPQP
ncbi:MAG TPA: hypothetical protein VJ691_04665 [Vicinamibacterales bacterium]|nr:hypothetical protein [Vicinamibacterales bacterium]